MRVRPATVAVGGKHDRFENWLLKGESQHDLIVDWRLEIREAMDRALIPTQ